MIIHPDAYTRTCQAGGCAYDASNFDDPSGSQVWMQDNCPDCYDPLPPMAATNTLHAGVPTAHVAPPWAIVV